MRVANARCARSGKGFAGVHGGRFPGWDGADWGRRSTRAARARPAGSVLAVAAASLSGSCWRCRAASAVVAGADVEARRSESTSPVRRARLRVMHDRTRRLAASRVDQRQRAPADRDRGRPLRAACARCASVRTGQSTRQQLHAHRAARGLRRAARARACAARPRRPSDGRSRPRAVRCRARRSTRNCRRGRPRPAAAAGGARRPGAAAGRHRAWQRSASVGWSSRRPRPRWPDTATTTPAIGRSSSRSARREAARRRRRWRSSRRAR